jgi:uncharacterized NAD(P)/FAD-binding protein YdhS
MRTGSERIAIIGGGASGVLTALHLQRAACPPERLVVVEPRDGLGHGIAYSTTELGHLLNVRAACLSALPDDPGHFTAWAARHTVSDGRSFLPRAWYGEYLNSLLGPVEHIRRSAVDLIPLGLGVQIILSDGELLHVDRAVLAPGSSPPRWPGHMGGLGPRWVRDPWAPGALGELPAGGPVLLVGTGLTAVDIALSLQASGREVVAASRHGLLPAAHRDEPSDPIRLLLPDHPTARTLLAWARAAAAELGDWPLVVESLRSLTNDLWEGMSAPERVRLLRHIHRSWEVLRHRMPPQVDARIRDMQETGQLKVLSGGVERAEETGRGIDVTLADESLRVTAVVNCTGPTADVNRTSHLLVRRLLDRRVARPGPLDLGLDTDARGCLPNTDETLWLVGPLRRGRHWETTAIPEIRKQAAALAASLSRATELVGV